MRVTPKSAEIAENVVKNIEGRAADVGISLPFVASMVAAAPDGDHVEIGALFGASAIAAALMKKELGHKGKVYCIDPYDAEERAKYVSGNTPEVEATLSGTPELLMENAKKFGVELELVQAYSDPWPEELKDNTFVTAYVDGDHLGEIPWKDFENLRGRVTDYIAFDNFEEEYPDVVDAAIKAANSDDWFLYYKNLSFLALRRILPARTDQTAPFQLLSL